MSLVRPDRLPLAGDWASDEYRKDVYHLGEMVHVEEGEVRVAADGGKKYTRDGGIWGIGNRDLYRDAEDVLNVDLAKFSPEEVGSEMLDEMSRLQKQMAAKGFPLPRHYGTLVSRAIMEFDWIPFLTAAVLDEDRFAEILACFGEASLAVAHGWAQTEGVELIQIHDDIAATRGPFLSPDWLKRHVFPWYRRIFDSIHEHGRKAIYVCDGNYMPILDDIIETGPDGLYIESTSMDPAEFMRRAGKDKMFMLKSNTRNIDVGTPEDVRQELLMIRELHQEYPGIIMYRGGNQKAECVDAFDRYYQEYLVYE